MAVRVRKLAREIQRSPAEVLGLLHALGFSKYKSAEDMVADAPASKTRKAVKMGMTAEPVTPVSVRGAKRSKSVAAPVHDVMGALVAGVAPTRVVSKPVVVASQPVAPPRAVPSPGPSPELVQAQQELAALKVKNAALESERHALLAVQHALETERDARDQVEKRSLSLEQLLEQRGLRGPEEQVAAVQAILGHHWARTVILGAAIESPGLVAAHLTERLLLVGGAFPELHGCATVEVPSDRAEVPDGDSLARDIRAIGEGMMLNGFKRLCAVGVAARWQKLLREHIDDRIALRFLPGGPRDALRVRNDCEAVDVVWTWEALPNAQISALYEAESAAWVSGDGGGIRDALGALSAYLSGDRD